MLKRLQLDRQEWKYEISGILVLGLAVFLLICLVSFSPQDPSWNTAAIPGREIHNFSGRLGAIIADLLVQAFGLAAVVIPLYLFGIFLTLLASKKPPPWSSYPGAVLLLLSTSIWTSLISPTFTYHQQALKSGGVFGYLMAALFLSYLNQVGTCLLMLVIFSLAIIVTTHISPLKLMAIVAEGFLNSSQMLSRACLAMLVSLRQMAARQQKKAKDRSAPAKPVIKIEKKPKAPAPEKEILQQEILPFFQESGKITLPRTSMLDDPPPKKKVSHNDKSLLMQSQILEKKLLDYGVEGQVTEVYPGPVVTMFEFRPAAGTKLNKIVSLADDLALALSAMSVRIVAPIPGKSVVGIEIPNLEREDVYFKELIVSDAFQTNRSLLPLALGKDIGGAPFVSDLTKMPHLLIAGSTGSGKSVAINTMICSILFKSTPEQVRFIMVDPKMLELSIYDNIPNLLLPVVTNPKRAAAALRWAVDEMERRYSLMSESGTRNILAYNKLVRKQAQQQNEDEQQHTEMLPYIVVVIDELADLMMVAAKDVEESITRLAQMARAAGIHLVLATQRPSVDVITGLIKANFPARISFRVSSRVDSRTILDAMGAEHLLGNGDMLFLQPGSGTSNFTRLHGSFLNDREIRRVTDFLKKQGKPQYDDDMLKKQEEELAKSRKERNKAALAVDGGESDEEGYDELYDQAVAFVAEVKTASASLIQRKFRIGYNRAARIIETMEAEGVIGPAEGSKPRKVLIDNI
ncbi:MAG: DNA translocase FtsK 4TM domain-containing protein [Deltaproteobacteria bacterium]|nr:DNA translocase FtsK 4TM domain-containing protein [Candidatus Anaeroferrophillus wilburensis]MBN2888907.1 DNA translocase FtsK 4TM domain-containing protein [Deltaproteobacteria bacterium]